MNKEKIINKKGYLNKDYMFFHLKDKDSSEHNFHYHEFDKIVILLSGNVTYVIEGKEYYLQPYDVLLVNHHDIHKPIIDNTSEYERIVIWVNHDFLASHSTAEEDLSLCFHIAHDRKMSLMRFVQTDCEVLMSCLSYLEEAFQSDEFGSRIMANAYFLQYLIRLNRLSLKDVTDSNTLLVRYDKKILEIMNYINTSLCEDLSLERLAHDFYISKSYLMHKFKSETGYTLHNYVLQKRLLYSRSLLDRGTPVTEVVYLCGFSDYTTFLRAFKKLFGSLPSE